MRTPHIVAAYLGALVAPAAVSGLIRTVFAVSIGWLSGPDWLAALLTAGLYGSAALLGLWVVIVRLRARLLLWDAVIFVMGNALAIAAVMFFCPVVPAARS